MRSKSAWVIGRPSTRAITCALAGSACCCCCCEVVAGVLGAKPGVDDPGGGGFGLRQNGTDPPELGG